MKNKKKPILNINKKYGRLKIIKCIGQDNGHNYVWECLCDCGNTKNVSTRHLRSCATKSCGCFRKEFTKNRNRKEKGQSGFTSVKNSYITSSRDRNLKFELSIEDLHKIFKMNCAYCGIEPKQIKYGSNVTNLNDKEHCKYIYNGIDRVDNKLGYTKDNSVPCCQVCNKMKLELGFDEFLDHINKIVKRFHRYYKEKKVS